MKSNSWIIVNKQTGEAIFETWNPNVRDKINTSKYKAVPAYKYLCNLNRQIKADQ